MNWIGKGAICLAVGHRLAKVIVLAVIVGVISGQSAEFGLAMQAMRDNITAQDPDTLVALEKFHVDPESAWAWDLNAILAIEYGLDEMGSRTPYGAVTYSGYLFGDDYAQFMVDFFKEAADPNSDEFKAITDFVDALPPQPTWTPSGDASPIPPRETDAPMPTEAPIIPTPIIITATMAVTPTTTPTPTTKPTITPTPTNTPTATIDLTVWGGIFATQTAQAPTANPTQVFLTAHPTETWGPAFLTQTVLAKTLTATPLATATATRRLPDWAWGPADTPSAACQIHPHTDVCPDTPTPNATQYTLALTAMVDYRNETATPVFETQVAQGVWIFNPDGSVEKND